MLNACAEGEGYAVMGGGHTATLVSQRGLADKMGHVSTGGGACLDLLAGRTLPECFIGRICQTIQVLNL